MLVLHARYLERRSLLARSKEFRVVRNALKDRGFPVTVRAECRLAEATQLSSASLSQASAPLTITVSGDAFHRGRERRTSRRGIGLLHGRYPGSAHVRTAQAPQQ